MRHRALTRPRLTAPFSIEVARRPARELLRSAPPLARLVRPVPVGTLLTSFVVPLELLKSQNWSRGRKGGTLARSKDQLSFYMRCQAPPASEPLPGRPFVRCIRWSSVEHDNGADTFKMAVDILCLPNKRTPRGMSFLRDDRPKDATIVQSWEPAAPGEGFGLIEIYTGDPHADVVEKRVRRTKKSQCDISPRLNGEGPERLASPEPSKSAKRDPAKNQQVRDV